MNNQEREVEVVDAADTGAMKQTVDMDVVKELRTDPGGLCVVVGDEDEEERAKRTERTEHCV